MNNSYSIKDKEITIRKERERYNDVKQSYDIFSSYLVEEFKEVYKRDNKNLKDVYDRVMDQGNEKILNLCLITADYLREEGILDISGEEFFSNYKKTDRYRVWEKEVEKIQAKYLDLVKESGSKDQEKDEGFLKSTLEFIEDKVDKGVSFFEKSSIYRDENTLENLGEALYFTCFNMHRDYIHIVERNKGEKLYSYVSLEAEKEAQDLFEEIKKYDTADSAKIDGFNRIIDLNPYKHEYYAHMFKIFGDENGDLENLANKFGFSLIQEKLQALREEYLGYKFLIMEDKEIKLESKGFINRILEDDNDLRQKGYIWKPVRIELIELLRLYLIKINLINFSKSISLDTNNSIIEEMDIKIENYRDRFTYVNGINFITIENSIEAKIERESIIKLIDSINLGSREDLKSSIGLIEVGIDTEVKDLYLNMLEEKYLKLTEKEIESLIDESNTDNILSIENLIAYIENKYDEIEREKFIGSLNNKIKYIKTKDKVSETYDNAVKKGKEIFKKFFD